MNSKIKQLAMSFDSFIDQAGVGAALFFVLLELIAVNTKSLYHVFGADHWYNFIWALLGAMGYSIVTTVIIRKNVEKWLKLSFPTFDMFLVFIGMNIANWGTLLDNPLRFAVTIFFSLFTGATIMALGLINYSEYFRNIEIDSLNSKIKALQTNLLELNLNNDKLKSEIDSLQRANSELDGDYGVMEEEKMSLERQLEVSNSMLDEYKSKLRTLNSEISKIRNESEGYKTNYNSLFSDLKQYQSEMLALKSQLDRKTTEIEKMKSKLSDFDTYKRAYYNSERSRILKKKLENRTNEEIDLLIKTEK